MPREEWRDVGAEGQLPGPAAELSGAESDAGGWVWPAAIIGGLLLVVAVNVGFAVVAVSGADEIVKSYLTEER
jgi:uncharacterized protein with LGFP repeats